MTDSILDTIAGDDAEARLEATLGVVGRFLETREIEAALPGIAAALGSPDEAVVCAIADGLGAAVRAGMNVACATQAVVRALEQAPATARKHLAMTIAAGAAELKGKDGAMLRKALADPDPEVRAMAARALARSTDLGHRVTSHVSALVVCLKDRSATVRAEAYHALEAYARRSSARAAEIEVIHRAFAPRPL